MYAFQNMSVWKRRRSDTNDESSDSASLRENLTSADIGKRQRTHEPGEEITHGSAGIGQEVQLYAGSAHGGIVGNTYGETFVSGNAQVQLGNSYHFHPKEDPDVSLKRVLYYEAMDARKAQLDQIDATSFDWIWTDTTFPEWLRNGQGIYWISGKSGSGKSTLVSYLVEEGNSDIRDRLDSRYGDVLIVHFFFDFRAGNSCANSIDGLLRSLLLQYIKKSPRISQHVKDRCIHCLNGQWSASEAEMLSLICESILRESKAILMFIDGLDEYVGSLPRLADTLLLMQKKTSIMLCLASRPEVELKHKLGQMAFELQNCNKPTILAYAQSAISSVELPLSDNERASVVEKITGLAEGVILWVKVALDGLVDELLKGLRLEAAMRNLLKLSVDLQQMYEQVFSRLEQPETQQAAIALFIVYHWDKSWSDDRFYELGIEELLMIHCRTRYYLGDPGYAEFACDNDSTRYRLWIGSMLHGLLEFIEHKTTYLPMNKPKIMHRSLEFFLESSIEIQLQWDAIQQVLDSKTLAPTFLCQNIVVASAQQTKSCHQTGTRDDLQTSTGREVVYHSDTDFIFFSTRSVEAFLGMTPGDVSWDKPELATWYLEAIQTHLYREKYRRFLIPDHLPPQLSKIASGNPELIDIAYEGFPSLLALALKQSVYGLSENEVQSLNDLDAQNLDRRYRRSLLGVLKSIRKRTKV